MTSLVLAISVAGQPLVATPAQAHQATVTGLHRGAAHDSQPGTPESSPPPRDGWDDDSAEASAAPPSTQSAGASPPPPAVSPEYATSQPPPPADAPRRASPAGSAMLATGVTLIVIGGVSLLFVAVPSAIVKSVALDRARRDPVIAHSSREERYRRARRADDAMEAGFWTGVAAIGVGLPLTIVGAVIRNRARSEVAQRTAIDGNGVGVRF